MSLSLVPKLVDTARAEWKRWGFSAVPVHGIKKIVGKEGVAPYVSFVHDYWVAVNEPTFNGKTPQPWSAAFISYCFKQAGAAKEFPYNEGHAGYCGAFIRNPAKYPKLSFGDPATTKPQLGDLIFAGRGGGGCGKPPPNHAAALAELKKPDGFFCSHADIVVAVGSNEIDVIGGNVQDSVTQTTYVTNNGFITDPRHNWLAVIKNKL